MFSETHQQSSTANEVYDIVINGGDPLGLSAAYEVAKPGKKVAVFEPKSIFHQAGSCKAVVRMFRTM